MTNKKLGYEIRIGNTFNYYETPSSKPIKCRIINILHNGYAVIYEFKNLKFSAIGATIYPEKLKPFVKEKKGEYK